jgi:hypothetical protein
VAICPNGKFGRRNRKTPIKITLAVKRNQYRLQRGKKDLRDFAHAEGLEIDLQLANLSNGRTDMVL